MEREILDQDFAIETARMNGVRSVIVPRGFLPSQCSLDIVISVASKRPLLHELQVLQEAENNPLADEEFVCMVCKQV